MPDRGVHAPSPRPCRGRASRAPRLIYSSLASLDGYIADEGGGFDWAVPDEEVLAFITHLERPVGT
jgi:hypothetical protein